MRASLMIITKYRPTNMHVVCRSQRCSLRTLHTNSTFVCTFSNVSVQYEKNPSVTHICMLVCMYVCMYEVLLVLKAIATYTQV